MMEEITDLYTPESFAYIFKNNVELKNKHDLQQIFIKGILKKNGSKPYSGYYYDKLEDESLKQEITIKIPQCIRQNLKEGSCYKFKGCFYKKTHPRGYLQPIFSVNQLISEEKRLLTEEEFEKGGILKIKREKGLINVRDFVRKKLYNEEFVKLGLIYGENAIVDEDVNKAIDRAKVSYDFHEFKVSLNNKEKILSKLEELNSLNYDIVGIVRGGGSDLDLKIFDDNDIARTIVNMDYIFVSAIGHAENKSFIDKIADESFDTPTSLGVYFKEIVEFVKNKNKEEVRQESEIDFLKERLNVNEDKINSLENEKEQYEKKYVLLRNLFLALLISGTCIFLLDLV